MVAARTSPNSILVHSEDGKTASLVYFCPGCGHYHSIPVRGTNENGHGPWDWDGEEETPTLKPSVRYRRMDNGGTHVCHHFVEQGRLRFLNDSTHALSGRIVKMVPV